MEEKNKGVMDENVDVISEEAAEEQLKKGFKEAEVF